MTWVIDPAVLEPLRAALLERAHRDADAVVADAEERATGQLEAAIAAADARVAAARARGEADAAAVLARDEARTRQQARALILAARCSVYDELRRRTHDGVRKLRDEPAYVDLRSNLTAKAGTRLGSAAVSREATEGGCVIETAGKRVEATLDALADWALETVAEGPAGWTP